MSGLDEVLRADVLVSVLDRELTGIALFEPIQDGADFRVVYANPAFQALKPHVPMVGQIYSDVWPEAAHRFMSDMLRVIETGRPWVERDLPVEVEAEQGVVSTQYYTLHDSRVEIDGTHYLLSEVQATTAEVLTRQQAMRDLETTRQLFEATSALTERVELSHVLRKLAEVLLAATAHTRSFVFLWNEERRELTRAASAGQAAFPEGQAFSFDNVSKVTQGVITGRHTAIVDFDALPEEQRGTALAAERSHVLVVVPVVWQDRLVGLIGVDDPGERREFTEREVELVEGIAAQASVAIENARLFQEVAESLQALKERDRAIRQAYSDVIDAVTGGRLILLGADEMADVTRATGGVEYEIYDASKLGEARRHLREALGDIPLLSDLTLAFSEGVTNMLKHAGGGRYRAETSGSHVRIVLSDSGPGINFHDLPKATLVPGFSTQQTLGMGFTLMIQLADRLLLCSDCSGTTLVLEKDLPV